MRIPSIMAWSTVLVRVGALSFRAARSPLRSVEVGRVYALWLLVVVLVYGEFDGAAL
jgi:hypothetical protein